MGPKLSPRSPLPGCLYLPPPSSAVDRRAPGASPLGRLPSPGFEGLQLAQGLGELHGQSLHRAAPASSAAATEGAGRPRRAGPGECREHDAPEEAPLVHAARFLRPRRPPGRRRVRSPGTRCGPVAAPHLCRKAQSGAALAPPVRVITGGGFCVFTPDGRARGTKKPLAQEAKARKGGDAPIMRRGGSLDGEKVPVAAEPVA
mmetsp:Transcript_22814/g.51447  ORF Transcript_22814/g.51447 Transcript_22814/m.51447 type:complete len:202 (-) Transcript_22814:281-886(-)